MRKPRILIANRGEIAVRIIRTCRELDIPTIAVYSDADRDALHVELADAAFRIGPALAADSYLSIGAILEACRKSRATLVHPGYGFLAERSHFARAVAEAGHTFIGPPADAIELMGDKAAARRAAEEVGVPIVPGTPEPMAIQEASVEAERIGFPLVVKAAFGGGGKGMHVVRSPEQLEDALRRAAREAQAYFGRPEVFLERYIERAHHVEAQILADAHGNVSFLGERDCTVQRRHQKLIEETPSPIVDDDLRQRIGDAAIALAKRADYVNAGTVECIVDEDRQFYFLEMNTRLQVEHTVTEMVTGLDLVALQIAVALGERVDVETSARGHAIQCRINAEDPGRNFLPGPGRVTRYREPSGPFVRLDSGVREGKEIPGDYDSMFAKLVVSAEDRHRARARMLRALDEFIVEGVPTTIPLHRWVLETPAFRDSTHTTTWLERQLHEIDLPAQTDVAAPAASPMATPKPADVLLEVDGRRVPVRIFDERRAVAPRPPARHGGHHAEHVHGVITAPMQGTILRVLVERGQRVEAGDVICILEAMKMENHIASTRDGEITELPIEPGQVVVTGQTLAVID
ncbi:MAG TPA: biotin carboxylase N-terminal domain-containing protein [Actinomycetota bacterium]|nr:biotin carboxylase N-terminal domain-containing protein [Actinomycetota bacterium]